VLKEKGIQTVSNEIAAALRGIRGAVDVFPDQIVGRTYLEVAINREKAARYGVNVADISDAIEVAMGGKTITTTVEGRQRFPVRVRYARDFWQTEDALRNILVTGRRGSSAPKPVAPGVGAEMGGGPSSAGMGGEQIIQVPISDVADIRVVEGPSMIKSENGMLRSYVQLNDLRHPLHDLQRLARFPADHPGRARRARWRRDFPKPVWLRLQRGRLGRLHRLLRHGHTNRHRHARLPARSHQR
jgi:Cu/Ag efflux pump CusA